MFKILTIIILISPIAQASEKKYIVPSDIKELSVNIVRKFKQIQFNMVQRYLELKNKSQLSEAEFQEFLAYHQIFGIPLSNEVSPLRKFHLN